MAGTDGTDGTGPDDTGPVVEAHAQAATASGGAPPGDED
jgi:hypothetical protein